jgi:hypothetical protein
MNTPEAAIVLRNILKAFYCASMITLGKSLNKPEVPGTSICCVRVAGRCFAVFISFCACLSSSGIGDVVGAVTHHLAEATARAWHGAKNHVFVCCRVCRIECVCVRGGTWQGEPAGQPADLEERPNWIWWKVKKWTMTVR